MSRNAKVWWNAQKGTWCTELGGKRRTLAKGKKNKKQAQDKLKQLLEEQALLADMHGAVSVARLCEEFFADSAENLERKTYESYRYACQKFVDQFGARPAHTIEPLDITRFSKDLKQSVGDSTRGLILRSLRRCFNWGVEHRVIPPHRLGRIRIPQAKSRDRFGITHSFDCSILVNELSSWSVLQTERISRW